MNIRLADGNSIPTLGLGVAGIPVNATAEMTGVAIDAGYRLIDTAVIYKTEAEVGQALAASQTPRDDLFITTKVWPDCYGFDQVMTSFDESMAQLGLEMLDMYMLHWPAPTMDKYVESWRALIELQQAGRVRSIGVSNFLPDQLQRLADETGVMPVINQIELHPYSQRTIEQAFHEKHNIITESYSPLGRRQCFDDPVLTSIANKYGRTTAQVMLRWHIDAGRVAIPRSSSPERIRGNLDVAFALDDADHIAIAGLDKGFAGKLDHDPEFAR